MYSIFGYDRLWTTTSPKEFIPVRLSSMRLIPSFLSPHVRFRYHGPLQRATRNPFLLTVFTQPETAFPWFHHLLLLRYPLPNNVSWSTFLKC